MSIIDIIVQGKGSIINNTMFIYPKGKELSQSDLNDFVQANEQLSTDYRKRQRMYLGQHDILNQDKKKIGPDNRLVANLAHYIVETFNGFFMGVPPKITLPVDSENEALQQWQDTNSFQDKLNEISKQADIYGRSLAFLYQNENSETQVAYQSPVNAFMIYDDSTAHNPLAFVRYTFDDEGQISGSLYYAKEVTSFGNDFVLGDAKVNPFQEVPAVEFYDNEERQGIFDNVTTLIDSLDKTLSQKANQNEYFDNAYLAVLGLNLDSDGDGKPDVDLTENQMIYSDDPESVNARVEFLQKPDGDNMQEHQLDRLINMIYQISMVANLNDEAFSGNSSGVALQYKLLPMKNLAASKERKFTQALRRLYQIAFKVQNITPIKADSWQDLSFQFIRNLPINLADEATTAQTLEGIVSKETQLSTLSIVDDPKTEIEQMQKEADDRMASAVQNSPAAIDAQKSDDNQKVTDDAG